MTRAEYAQLKSFALQDGALLALLMIFTFVMYLMGITSSWLSMTAMFLIFYTPVFVYERLRHFRDYGLQGVISFLRAYAYTVMVFFYGGVLFAVAQYVYFAYIDQGYLMSEFMKILSSEEGQRVLKDAGMQSMVDDSLAELMKARPIDIALNMLTMNIVVGFILGVPIGMIAQRRVKRSQE